MARTGWPRGRLRAGAAWVGPGELLGLLETALGLAVPHEAFSARVAALVPHVRSTRGFWSESAEVDPLSTSRRLLEWRDTLQLHGWRGQAVSPRLGAMAELTQGLTGAPADRLLAVRDDLGGGGQVLESLLLHVPVERLPWAWREVCSSLAARGTRLEVEALTEASATGDLLAACPPGFVPQRDGSLQLIRPTGPLEAAEEVASALAALPSLQGVVLIGADTLSVGVRVPEPREPVARETRPEAGAPLRAPVLHPPAFLQPSMLEGRGRVLVAGRLGERTPLTGEPEMADLGQAVHGFLAADRKELSAEQRLTLATRLLSGLERAGRAHARGPAGDGRCLAPLSGGACTGRHVAA
ncbi:hypothetical protein [Melittangium boletus]|uniref:hypothetical protein n=1 Tax=Melittangium boletus TaxID=83453 RepID=UPI003DA37B2F